MARPLHDKASYNIIPTPPSPRDQTSPSPPSLSPSNSNFNSAGSTTEPTTPPPRPSGRTRKPYPEGVGRVPLHRRGTSKTYERLEDLLREAGYKETRIFTPETERTASQDETKSPNLGSTFVGFLSNLVPSRTSSLKREEDPDTEIAVPVYSPPSSPSLNRTPRPHATRSSVSQQQSRRNRVTDSPTQRPSVRRDSKAGPLSPSRSVADMQQRHHRVDSIVPPLPSDDLLQQLPSLHQPKPQRPVNRYYQHHPSSSRTSIVASPPPPQQPTPTRASTYLRHMTSFDRPQSTPPTYTRMTDDAEEESLLSPTIVPRMPTNWMDNVKRAREYFAAPALPPISGSPAPASAAKLGRTVSVKTRGRLSDRTNANANASLAPPLLTTRLSTARAKRSESQVSVGRVVCRSRGSSPVRRDKGKARAADLDLRGQFELPDPEQLKLELARSRFLGGWGTTAAGAQLLSPPRRSDGSALDSGESDASSEGEEELTLARILIPSRHAGPAAMERSRSVRSLRRCLELDGQIHGHGQGDIPPVPPLPGAEGNKRWSLSLSWGRARGGHGEDARGGEDGSEEGEVYLNVAAGRGSTRQRGGLPSWGN
ncbi:hypothetical protein R3P38DRAFT_2846179 [Favolaschia claudopus]|uniref:Uncharacterized protein n=1 Tax=Favolaschia claudopus TaxID=2862362 RepID=A0AAW0DUK9_9AGAR